MAIEASTLIAQRDFSAGEVTEDALRRDDLDFVRAGARQMKNFKWGSAGNLVRRDGDEVQYVTNGRIETVNPKSGVIHDLVFRDSEVRIYEDGNATVLQTIDTDAPWDDSNKNEMSVKAVSNLVFIAHQSFQTRILTYDRDGGTWALSKFEFLVDETGAPRMPFYRFAGHDGVTLDVADLGQGNSHTITFSGSVLTIGHIGTHFTYAGRVMKITGVNSAIEGTAENVEELPRTWALNPEGSHDGLRIGDIVRGVDSNAYMQLGRESGNWFYGVLQGNLAGFNTTEDIVGTDVRKTLTSSVVAAIEPTLIWKEQFMSDHRGWPGYVDFDRGRLIFANFAQFPEAILWSAVDIYNDFKVTADADGAIFEYIPADLNVLSVIGGSDQFVMTDKSTYYIPISASNPLAPGSVEFRRIGSGSASSARPVNTNEGVVFISQDKNRVMSIVPTGQTARPYLLRNISRFSPSISGATQVAVSQGDNNSPGEYIFVLNDDGSLAYGRFDPEQEWVGFIHWTREGSIESIATRLSRVLFSEQIGVDAAIVSRVTKVSGSSNIDLRHLKSSGLDVATVAVEGGYEFTFADISDLVGADLDVWVDNKYTGKKTVKVGGVIDLGAAPASSVIAGFNFAPKLMPFVPNFAGGESFKQRTRVRKLKQLLVTTRGSTGYKVSSGEYVDRVAVWNAGEDQGQQAPNRDQTDKFRFPGRDHDPEIIIEQDVPGSLKILEVTMEVTA